MPAARQASIARSASVFFEGQRLLAKDRLAGIGRGDDLLTVQRMRRRYDDCVDRRISQHRL